MLRHWSGRVTGGGWDGDTGGSSVVNIAVGLLDLPNGMVPVVLVRGFFLCPSRRVTLRIGICRTRERRPGRGISRGSICSVLPKELMPSTEVISCIDGDAKTKGVHLPPCNGAYHGGGKRTCRCCWWSDSASKSTGMRGTWNRRPRCFYRRFSSRTNMIMFRGGRVADEWMMDPVCLVLMILIFHIKDTDDPTSKREHRRFRHEMGSGNRLADHRKLQGGGKYCSKSQVSRPCENIGSKGATTPSSVSSGLTESHVTKIPPPLRRVLGKKASRQLPTCPRWRTTSCEPRHETARQPRRLAPADPSRRDFRVHWGQRPPRTGPNTRRGRQPRAKTRGSAAQTPSPAPGPPLSL